LHGFDGPGDRGALATPGDPQQGLEAISPLDALGQLGDRGGLVARRREVGHHLEIAHHIGVGHSTDGTGPL